MSPEFKSKVFTHALVMQFNCEFDQDSVYLPDSKHLSFAKNPG